MILDRDRVERYLALARELGRAQPLYDVHVSPYEVIFCALDHRPDPDQPGLHSLEGAVYGAPRPGPLRVDDDADPDRPTSRAEPPAPLSAALLRRQYAHLGPRVVGDQMALSGIRRSLLIPVHRPGGRPDEQVQRMFQVYRGDPRFVFAYCPRQFQSTAALIAEIRGVAAAHPLRALKVNPNIQGLDLSTPTGRASLEHLLAASRATALPLVVHGGISRLLADPRGQAFAALDRLASFGWRDAALPVVISHAGLFGCSSGEVAALLPVLDRMLDDHPNLLVDISGLGVATLRAVLGRVDPERIVFGSDALYFPQWSAVVKVLYALDRLGLPLGETFARIAGTTPARHIFQEERP